MKFKKTVSVLLATAVAAPCLLSMTACAGKNTGKQDTTAYGNKTITAAVKKPKNDVTITLIRGKNVLKTDVGSLEFNEALKAGDIIEIASDYKYINVNLFDGMGEQLIYSPSGQFTFQIPSTASQVTYAKGTFAGENHTFTASVASKEAITKADRNLALNVYDYMYIDEKNDQTVADNAMDEELVESVALSQVAAFPHAYANRVTRNEVGFYARNAIDGNVESAGHGNYPYQSWGYNQMTDAEFTVYFGREVTVSEVGFVLRADYSGTPEHDTHWNSVTLEFSDGSTQEVTGFEKSGNLQKFTVDSKTTSFVRIKDIKEEQNNSQMFAALTELEVYGKEKVSKNEAAVKTSITTAFGGKEQDNFSTGDYSYDEIKTIMDKSNDWFINKTETENYQIKDWSLTANMQVKIDDAGWKDAVYYSGLTESFMTTGDMDSYYFMRAVGNQFKYLNNNGSHTAHGDYFQIGESYLQLNDLKNANYKFADTLANAEYVMNRDYNDTNFTGFSSAKSADKKKDWDHMGYWWCDALYMAMNSYTLLTLQTGEDKYAKAAYEGYTYWKNVLYNSDYDLWYRDQGEMGTTTGHIDPATGKEYPVFWSRGNAWVLAALAKQLMYLDEDEFPEMYETYLNDYLALAESIAKYQRDDGLWNASIVDGEYYGGKESTGTMGYIYAYCIGLRLGVLDSSYYDIVKDAWEGIVEYCIFEDGQVGYMQTTGYQPYNYQSEEFSKKNTHEFGMGLFLLACSGMMSICSDYKAPSVIIPADPQAALLG